MRESIVKFLALLSVMHSLRKMFLNHKGIKYSRVTEIGTSLLKYFNKLVHCRVVYTWPLRIIGFHMAPGFISVKAVEGRQQVEPSDPLPLNGHQSPLVISTLSSINCAFTSWPIQSPSFSVFVLQMFQVSVLKLGRETRLFNLRVLWRPGPSAVNPANRMYQTFEPFVGKSWNQDSKIVPFSSLNL